MSMNKIWHVIGTQFNNELDKDVFIDYQINNCETVDDALKKAKENGVKNISGAFLSSMLVSQEG